MNETLKMRLSRTAALLDLVTQIRAELRDPSAGCLVEESLMRRELQDFTALDGSNVHHESMVSDLYSGR